jgi:CheY-like chemotaxis protein
MVLRSKTILIAEDEFLVRMDAMEMVAAAGYTVLEAEHAADAIGLLEQHSADIFALFTDVHMPGEVNGIGLAHHTNKNWPWIHILIASGIARPSPHELPAGARFIAKPYRAEHVVGHIREMFKA